MKRSITRWTTTLATAVVLTLPAVGLAQSPSTTPPRTNPQPPTQQPTPEPPSKQPPAPQPPSTQPPATEPTTSTAPSSAPAPSAKASPEEHLRQAEAALDAIPAATLSGRARTQVAEVKKHMTALNRTPSASATGATGTSQRGTASTGASANANWGTEVAAIDKVLTDLLGSGSPTATGAGSGTAGATGTTGTAGTTGSAAPTGSSSSSSKTTASTTLDEATRARLMEVRTHITAYAAAKAGSETTTPKGGDAASAAGAASGTAAATTEPSVAGATAAQGSTATTQTGAAPAQAGATAAQGSTATTQTGVAPTQAGATGSEPAAGSAVQAQPAGQVDEGGARRSLTAARDTLSQLTQLPAATQLTGEARTQVAQLISNFNELITTQVEWRAIYAKVAANLNALLGPDNAVAEATGGAASPAAGTAQGTVGTTGSTAGTAEPGAAGASTTGSAGAVGTSGTTTIQIDPAIQAKLIELRRNLSEFEKASGGAKK